MVSLIPTFRFVTLERSIRAIRMFSSGKFPPQITVVRSAPLRKSSRVDFSTSSVSTPRKIQVETSNLKLESRIYGPPLQCSFCNSCALTVDIAPGGPAQLSSRLGSKLQTFVNTHLALPLSSFLGVCRILEPGGVLYPQLHQKY